MKVAVIGAGPAGAMAARQLARAGASVLLFDHSHPREKPCGGGLTGRAMALIDGVLDLRALPSVVIHSAVVEPPTASSAKRADQTNQSARVDLIARGPGADSSLVVLSRAVFDHAMLGAAVNAGSILIAEKVTAVERVGTSMRVETGHGHHRVDFVIGADGANSLVRKTFSRAFDRSQLSVAAGYFVRGARATDIVIKCMREQPGYLWSFPRPDHLAVGVCAPATARVSSATLQEQTLAWVRASGIDDGRVERYAWPIPTIAGRDSTAPVAGNGWMLVGDAAGLVDPLTREGIYYALGSGKWAAEALGNSRRAPAEAYEERLAAEVYPELERAAHVSAVFFSPRFSTLFVGALRQSEAIRRVFRDLTAGTQAYRGLRRRLLATREWKLAGEAARTVVQLVPLFQGETPA